MQFKDIIEELQTFIDLVDNTSTVPEFVIRSNLFGYFFANKEYFDNKIFRIIFDNNISKRGKILQLSLELRKRLPKLNEIYKEFSKYPDICDHEN